MPVESILAAAREGLAYERLRMEAASRNIAASNVPVQGGKAAQAWRVDVAPGAGFGSELDTPSLGTVETPTRSVHDPDHPMADANGMVAYPSMDLVQEMTALMTASRAYEANVRSFNLLRSMTLRALEIGSK